jgi:hypothetical protein
MCCCWKKTNKKKKRKFWTIYRTLKDSLISNNLLSFLALDAKNTLYIKKYPSKEETSSVILVVFLLTLCFNYCFIFAENKRKEKEEKIYSSVYVGRSISEESLLCLFCVKIRKIKDIRKVGKISSGCKFLFIDTSWNWNSFWKKIYTKDWSWIAHINWTFVKKVNFVEKISLVEQQLSR